MVKHTKFNLGQIIHHVRFDYRGVIVDIDPSFQGSDEWYESVALSRPPKDQPWYHVLVHDSEDTTYVAERHLEPDDSDKPITHPELENYFDEFRGGFYANDLLAN